jgi:hypothetical protein
MIYLGGRASPGYAFFIIVMAWDVLKAALAYAVGRRVRGIRRAGLTSERR